MQVRRVLIALDHSDFAAHAAEVGFELAGRLGAEAALVHAVDPKIRCTPKSGRTLADLIVQAIVDGRSLLERLARGARLPSSPLEFVPVGHPATEILQTAAEWKAEILILGCRRWSKGRQVLLGSVADEVMRHAPCSVFVVPAPEQTKFFQ